MKLIFVYNADAGLFNALADSAHKLLSPDTYACSLCAVTYGLVGMKEPWRDFVSGLPFPVEFLHRDELKAAYPMAQASLPALFSEEEGQLLALLESQDMDDAKSLDDLMKRVSKVLPAG